MYCEKCGTQLEEGTSFCPNCGASVAPEQNYTQADYQQQQYQQQQYQQPVGAPKSKTAAGLLGIFLGGLGIHNFYLGFTKRALIQLLVSLLSCGTAALAMEIWGIVEGIFYLTGHEGYTTDANGVPLGE